MGRTPGPQPDGTFYDPYDAMSDDEFFAYTDPLFAAVAPSRDVYDAGHGSHLVRGTTRDGRRKLVVAWVPRDGGRYPVHARPDPRNPQT